MTLDAPLAPLARVVQTCIAAPSQWQAETTDGTQLYFRYRHGRGRVELGRGLDVQPKVVRWFNDNGGSFISLEDFVTKAELTLAEGADVVALPEDDPDDLLSDDSAGGLPGPPGPPTPVFQGTFALYKPPEGGLVLAYRVKGSSDDKQLMIPPFILQMAGQASGLSTEDILSRLQSGDMDV